MSDDDIIWTPDDGGHQVAAPTATPPGASAGPPPSQPAPTGSAPEHDAAKAALEPTRSRWLPHLFLLGGVLGFVLLIAMAGPGRVVAQVVALGPYVLLVPLPYGVVYLLDALGFKLCLRRPHDHLGWLRTYVYRMAGEALNWTLPLAQMGGEPLKPFLLARAGVPPLEGGSAVVISKSAMVLSQLPFLVLALLTVALTSGTDQRLVLGAGLALMGAAGITIALLLGLRRGLFTSLARWLLWLGIARAAITNRLQALESLDHRIRGFASEEPWRLAGAFGVHLTSWVVGAMEVALVLWLLDAPIGIGGALAIEALVCFARAATAFIPASAGGQEGGILLIFGGFGLSADLALAYALLRRFREAIWTGFALCCLAAVGGAPARRAPTAGALLSPPPAR